MKKLYPIFHHFILMITLGAICVSLQGCKEDEKEIKEEIVIKVEQPEYFNLRPETEKAYGYTHAIKIGNDIKISGAVSMDNEGNPTAVGDFEQQMKNCYADLDK
ncbi:MAG: RidA family protein, partial [Flavobacteriales bacterium]